LKHSQKENLDAVYNNQFLLQGGLVSDSTNVDNMLAQPSSHKKRRTLAEDRDLLGKFSGNKDEWVKVLRAQEWQLERKEQQNVKNREKMVAKKKVSLVSFACYHLFNDVLANLALYILSDDNGPPCGGAVTADVSAAAAALKK
jgi:hypothetical protein